MLKSKQVQCMFIKIPKIYNNNNSLMFFTKMAPPSMSFKTLAEFIDILRNESCLWSKSSENYSNRSMQNLAYEKLLKKIQEDIKDANVWDVNRKIIALKIKSSDEDYAPKIWYFDSIQFLKNSAPVLPEYSSFTLDDEDQNADDEKNENERNMEIFMESSASVNKIEGNDTYIEYYPAPKKFQGNGNVENDKFFIELDSSEKKTQENGMSENDEIFVESLHSRGYSSKKAIKRKLKYSAQLKPLQPQIQNNSQDPDEYKSFSQTVERRLRNLALNNKMTAIRAEYLINKILYKAETGTFSDITEAQQSGTPFSIFHQYRLNPYLHSHIIHPHPIFNPFTGFIPFTRL